MTHEAPPRVTFRDLRFADMRIALQVLKDGYAWLMENRPEDIGHRHGIGYTNRQEWPHMYLYVYRPSPDSVVIIANYRDIEKK